MPDEPLNVVFIFTDQHRGDCVSADPQCPTDADGRPLVRTPNLDGFVERGALFSRAYSPAPKCVPARKCIWTGRRPESANATTDNNDPWEFENSLPELLRDAGYQTHLAGKTHSEPPRTHFGFEGLDLHSGIEDIEDDGLDDYAEWLDRKLGGEAAESSTGLGKNEIHGRPWHLDEHLHPTHWTTSQAEEFLRKRDPTRPFFLTVSYVRPHTPFDPPQAYWDQYVDRELPDPAWGDWTAAVHGEGTHPPESVHRARTGYYGSVSHVDQQLHRLVRRLNREDVLGNTLFVMTADHGELLGDHGLWRKSCAYEGAARVPMLLRFPDAWDKDPVGVVDRVTGLEDIAPTVLDAVGLDIPDTVQGRSLLDLCEKPDREDWRSVYHGEFSPEYNVEKACQFLVDEGTKYVWNPVTGRELLFDLDADPHEEHDLSTDPEHAEDLAQWRERLADRLADRPEGFVEENTLRTVEPDAWPGL